MSAFSCLYFLIHCLYLAYSSGDIHSAMFKDKKVALHYRKYDFSKVTDLLN